MSKENKKAITKLYYEDGYTLGRDKFVDVEVELLASTSKSNSYLLPVAVVDS